MRKLPTRIQIMGQTIKVEHCPNLLDSTECYGDWNPETNTIRVQTPNERYPLELCLQSYMHELLHCILDICGHGNDLSCDEGFVERVSQALFQSEQTRKYD